MKFLVFGTGDYYERYKKWFDKQDILALLDNSPVKQNTYIDGILVLSPKEGIKLQFDVIVILSFYVKEMKKQLSNLGVSEDRIYHFYDLHHLIYDKEKKKPVWYYEKDVQAIKPGKLFCKSKKTPENKVLLLSQDLTLGGPSIALFHAAKVLASHGYQIIYASMLDGPLREKLLSSDISVIVDNNLQIETMKEAEWTEDFSLIICNTINFYVFLSERDIKIPVIWWLHDSEFFYHGIRASALQNLDRSNLCLVSVGEVPAASIRKFIPDVIIRNLLYGVEDKKKSMQKRRQNMCFVTIGYIEERKGQDILVKAIQDMPDNIRKRAEFVLIGQDSSMMAQYLKIAVKDVPQIILTGLVDRDAITDILEEADVLICPSREDPMPTVAAEAMMHGVLCIVSDVTGTSSYIQDGIDGIIFENENAEELMSKIVWCIEHRQDVAAMAQASRKIYEKEFSMNIFEKNFLALVKEMI